jgi:DNA-binding IclR family transcriptional regulator
MRPKRRPPQHLRTGGRSAALRQLLAILRELAPRGRTIQDLTAATRYHRRTIYRCLVVLRQAGLLDSWRDGPTGYHRLVTGWWRLPPQQ